MAQKVYLGIKYHADNRNRDTINNICAQFEAVGLSTICIARDIEGWGRHELTPRDLMTATFREIDHADVVVLEMGEKGVGLGIEAGYAFARGIPIIILVPPGRDVSTTLAGIATQIVTYHTYGDIAGLARALAAM